MVAFFLLPLESQASSPVPFGDVRSLALLPDGAALLATSSEGVDTVAFVRLPGVEEVARVRASAWGGLATAGTRVVWAKDDRHVVAWDPQDGSPETLWQSADERLLTAPKSCGSSVWLQVRGEQGVRVARLSAGREPAFSIPLSVEGVQEVIPGLDSAVVTASGVAHAWHGSRWQDIPVPVEWRLLGISAEDALALDTDTNTLMRWPLGVPDARWLPAHRLPPGTGLVGEPHCGEFLTFLLKNGDRVTGLLQLGPGSKVAERPLTASWADTTAPALCAFDGRSLVQAVRRDDRWWLEVTALEGTAASAPATSASGSLDPPNAPARALSWLKAQVGPPLPGRPEARLIDSYEDGAPVGWTYDAALASIAFLVWGEDSLARELLVGLESLQQPDGSWRFAFEMEGTPAGDERYIGAMAWAVMAANFYEWHTGDAAFGPMARRGLDYIASFRVGAPESPLFGGITMGPVRPTVLSTEHNVDCYSAFLWRGRLERSAELVALAEGIRAFVLRELWAKDDAPPESRYFLGGYGDTDGYLDAQAWTVLSLGDETRDREDFLQALTWAQAHLAVEGASLGSVEDIRGFNERVGSPPRVWSEGSEGMVAALRALGLGERAEMFHRETARYQAGSGGIPYSTRSHDGWSTAPSVAGTAWFLLNAARPPANPFRPDAWRPAASSPETSR